MPLRLRKPIILCILIPSWFTIWKVQTKNLAMLPNMAMIHGWIIGKKWKGQSEKEVPSSFECPCCYKSKGNIVGAHVEDNEGNPYITPVCKDCNSRAINDAAFRDLNFPVANDELAPLPQQWQKPLHLSK